MASVRVLVGTKKGAFILTSDGKREKWDVAGPFFGGWSIYHMKGSPIDPNRIYASQCSDWFGQVIQRSDDGGKNWYQPGGEASIDFTGKPAGASNKFVYEGTVGTHMWYDGTQHPWEFKRVWHLEPSLTEVETVYAGAEDAALFRSTDGATTWQELRGLRDQQASTGLLALAEWGFIRSFWTPQIRCAFMSRSHQPARFEPTTVVLHGSQSIAG
jgi:hypothetical protein